MKDFLDSAGKFIELVPDAYIDGLKPTIQEAGKTLALIPRAINAVLTPLENGFYIKTIVLMKQRFY